MIRASSNNYFHRMSARIYQIESSACRKCGQIVSKTNMRAQNIFKGSPKRLSFFGFVDVDAVRPKVHPTVLPICCSRSMDSLWALISSLNLGELWGTADSAHCPLMSAPVLPPLFYLPPLFKIPLSQPFVALPPPTMDPSRPAFYASPLLRPAASPSYSNRIC
jgi:hypothetical protein